jgi:RES domain-containing protein
LTSPLRLWRIGRAGYPIWSGEGARMFGGRCNPVGMAAIYAGTSYAIAALETLVHANIGRLPKPMLYVEAVVPADAAIETVDPAAVPGWDAPDQRASQAFGAQWLRETRALVLLVPSVVTQGLDQNAVVNPLHPNAGRISVGPETGAIWDPRLPTGRTS